MVFIKIQKFLQRFHENARVIAKNFEKHFQFSQDFVKSLEILQNNRAITMVYRKPDSFKGFLEHLLKTLRLSRGYFQK